MSLSHHQRIRFNNQRQNRPDHLDSARPEKLTRHSLVTYQISASPGYWTWIGFSVVESTWTFLEYFHLSNFILLQYSIQRQILYFFTPLHLSDTYSYLKTLNTYMICTTILLIYTVYLQWHHVVIITLKYFYMYLLVIKTE